MKQSENSERRASEAVREIAVRGKVCWRWPSFAKKLGQQAALRTEVQSCLSLFLHAIKAGEWFHQPLSLLPAGLSLHIQLAIWHFNLSTESVCLRERNWIPSRGREGSDLYICQYLNTPVSVNTRDVCMCVFKYVHKCAKTWDYLGQRR